MEKSIGFVTSLRLVIRYAKPGFHAYLLVFYGLVFLPSNTSGSTSDRYFPRMITSQHRRTTEASLVSTR